MSRRKKVKEEENKVPPVEIRDVTKKEMVEFLQERLRGRIEELRLEDPKPSSKKKQYLESLERNIYRKPFILGYYKGMKPEHEHHYVMFWKKEYDDQKKKKEREKDKAIKKAEREAKKKNKN